MTNVGAGEYFSVVNKAGLIVKAFQISRIGVCIIIRYIRIIYSIIRHSKVMTGSVHYCYVTFNFRNDWGGGGVLQCYLFSQI